MFVNMQLNFMNILNRWMQFVICPPAAKLAEAEITKGKEVPYVEQIISRTGSPDAGYH